MDCEDAIQQISRAIESGGALESHPELRDHLEQCAACRGEAETQVLVRSILAARPSEALPPDFQNRLAARLDGLRPDWTDSVNWRTWSLRLMPAAAALLGIALVLERWSGPTSYDELESALIAWSTDSGDPAVGSLHILSDTIGRSPREDER